MAVQLGCMTLPYTEVSLDRALEGIASAGYRTMGFGTTHLGRWVPSADDGPGEIDTIRKKVEAHGLAVGMTLLHCEVALTAPNGVDVARRRLQQAHDLGAKVACALGPWYYQKWPDQPWPDPTWNALCDEWFGALAEIAPDAERLGVVIAPKPHTGICATSRESMDTVRRADSPAVRICWDAGNVSYYEGVNPDPGLADLVPWIAGLCIKDHRGPRANADFPIPGEGDIDHGLLFKTLLDGGFDGPGIVERVDGTTPKAETSVEEIDHRLGVARRNLQAILDRL